jgi:4-amino-4-deoxy-L-arabinose transferase-like glycosyltransferase
MAQPELCPSGSHQKWVNLALSVLFVAVSLAVRLQALDVFITPDELKWVCRSINFHRGLRTGDLHQTLQTGHPGVVTMWLGVPWMNTDPLQDWLSSCDNPSISRMIAEISVQVPPELARLLFAARRGVALLTSLAVGAAFLLLVRVFDRPVALVASVFVSLDPFYLAHSRFLHLDALITSLLFLSILCLLVSLRENRSRFLVLSGMLAGLAMLNKSPAMMAMPFAALALGLWTLSRRRSLGWLVRTGLLWLAPAVLTYALAWPAMWVQPGKTLSTVISTALFYAENPHTNYNYFWGAPRPDPGPAFYPVALAFRLTPWTTLGCVLVLPWFVRRHRWRDQLWILGGFVLAYALFMTLGQKKFDRYLLPVFPFVQTLAAVGLLGAADWFTSCWSVVRPRQLLALALSVLTLITAALTVVNHAPYYLTYYNPLLGGLEAARRTLLVGWGEGLDLAATYLNAMPNIEQMNAAARALPSFAPLFDGRTTDVESYDAATTHYVVFYLNEVQRRLSPRLLERYYDIAEPLHVVKIKGLDYAWVYENRSHEPPMTYIAANADSAKDAIVISRPSMFADDYRGALRAYVLQPGWRKEKILATLQCAAAQAERVWYVRYAEKNPDPLSEWIDFRWQTHTFLMDQQSYTDVDLFLWETKNGIPFVGANQIHRDLNLRLRGYTVSEAAAQWGRDLGVLFEWHALSDLDKYYASFVHIVDGEGRLWGQGDRWMVNEALVPTVSWKQGDFVLERSAVALNPGIPPGIYRLTVGVYDRMSRTRLPAMGSNEEVQGDSFDIGAVTVGPSPRKPSPSELPIENMCSVVVMPGIQLLGWGVDQTEVGFGEQLSVALFWQATDRPDRDYDARLTLVDPDGVALASGEFPIASSDYPTSQWETGEALWHFCDLRVSEDAPATSATLALDLLESNGEETGSSVDLTELWIEGHRSEMPVTAHAQPARIADHIRLLGFNVEPAIVSPGESVELTLYWQVDEPINRSYTVFTHLLDPAGVVRGQKDSIPGEGRYATTMWRPGEVVVDGYSIEIAPDAPGGDYRLEIGMYDPSADAKRLPLFSTDGVRQQDDRLLLDTLVRVES